MKKIYNCFLYSAIAAACIMTGSCVDKEYSLSNLELGDFRVGDVITTPPVKAHLTFEGLVGGMEEIEKILEDNGFSMDDIGIVEMFIGNEIFLVNLPLDIPLIPESMLDTLTPDGEGNKVELLLAIKSTLPMSLDFKIEFTDAAGEVITSFDEISIEKVEQGAQSFTDVQRRDITDILYRISSIKGINVTLLRPDLDKIKFLLDNYIEIEVRLEKTGGITLFE